MRRWIKAGKLRALRISGGTLRIVPEDLHAFEQQHGTMPPQGEQFAGLEPEESAGYANAAATRPRPFALSGDSDQRPPNSSNYGVDGIGGVLNSVVLNGPPGLFTAG